MSTINEALKKAQKQRDTRYHSYGTSLSAGPGEKGVLQNKTLLWVSLAVISLAIAIYLWIEFSGSKNKISTAQRVRPIPALQKTKGVQTRPTETGITGKSEVGQGREEPKTHQLASKDAGTDDAKASYERAMLLHKIGRLENAEKLYRETLKEDPGYVDALNNLGVLYLKDKDYESAQRNFKKAIRLRPGYADPYYNLACLFATKGDLEESLAYLSKAVALSESVRDWAIKDTDLENLWEMPEFKAIIGEKLE